MEKKEKKFWESSVEEGKLSMRIKGILYAFLPAILLVSKMINPDIEEQTIRDLVDGVVNLVAAITLIGGAATTIYGYLRREK